MRDLAPHHGALRPGRRNPHEIIRRVPWWESGSEEEYLGRYPHGDLASAGPNASRPIALHGIVERMK